MGINRNIVECKELFLILNFTLFIVLIETSWNVKAFRLNKRVETLGINRNIVECKERSDQNLAEGHGVLIETSWNVKERVKGDGVESLWY